MAACCRRLLTMHCRGCKRQRAAAAEKSDDTRSYSNTRDARTDDIDGDGARRRRKRARGTWTSVSSARGDAEAHAAHGDDDVDVDGISDSVDDDSESGDDSQRRATAESDDVALRRAQSKKQNKRRSVDRSARVRSSVWTTAAVASWTPDGSVRCFYQSVWRELVEHQATLEESAYRCVQTSRDCKRKRREVQSRRKCRQASSVLNEVL